MADKPVPFWNEYPREIGRMEWTCPHGVGHGHYVHGCCEDHCCHRDDFPGKDPTFQAIGREFKEVRARYKALVAKAKELNKERNIGMYL